MTKPRNIPQHRATEISKTEASSDTEVIVNNGKIQTKNEFTQKALPIRRTT